MKKMIVTTIMCTLSVLTFAQNTGEIKSDTTVLAVTEKVQKKTPIKIEDLPAAVKETLQSENFKDLKIESAFLVEAEIQYYEIKLLKGDEVIIVSITEEGKIIV